MTHVDREGDLVIGLPDPRSHGLMPTEQTEALANAVCQAVFGKNAADVIAAGGAEFSERFINTKARYIILRVPFGISYNSVFPTVPGNVNIMQFVGEALRYVLDHVGVLYFYVRYNPRDPSTWEKKVAARFPPKPKPKKPAAAKPSPPVKKKRQSLKVTIKLSTKAPLAKEEASPPPPKSMRKKKARVKKEADD